MYSIVLMMAMSGPAAEAPTFGRHGCHGATSCHGGFLGGLFAGKGCHGGGHGCHGSGYGCHGAGYACHGGGASCHGGNGCHGGHAKGGCHGGFIGMGLLHKHGCHGGSACYGSTIASSAGCMGSAPMGVAPPPPPGTPPAKMPEPPKK
jgi:hypothetical protein